MSYLLIDVLQSGKFGKLNKAVRFPEYLDLAPYMSGTNDKSPVYRLYAVVVHLDVTNAAFSGHYVCYVKSTQGKWYKTDDSMVCYLFYDHFPLKSFCHFITNLKCCCLFAGHYTEILVMVGKKE